MNIGRIILLLSYISIASASAAILTPALPQIKSDFSLPHGQIEWVINIFLIGYAVGQIFYGPLSNRIGRLGALRSGFTLNLAGITLCLWASYHHIYSWLLVGRLVTALGASAGLSCTFILLNESLTQKKAKHTLSFAVVSFTVGIGVAVLLGGIITQYWQWQACFWLLLFHGALALLSISLFKETLPLRSKLSLIKLCQDYSKAFCHTKLWSYSLLVGLVSLFSYCYSAAAPEIAQEQLGLTPAGYSYCNLINILGMLLGAMTAARLLQRYNANILLFISTSLLLTFFILLAIISYAGLLSTFAFFGITASCYFVASIIFPAASHQASNAIADKANAASSMNLINMGTAVIGVGIMGYLPSTMLWAMISVLTFAALISLGMFARQLQLARMQKRVISVQ